MADEHSSVAEPATDPRTDGDAASPFLGPNAWLVEEMYEQYRSDPGSVSENWRDFFEDYRSSRPQPVTAAAPAAAPTPAPPPPPAVGRRAGAAGRPAPRRRAARGRRDLAAAPVGKPILGAGALIVANMERSLGVPTATSFRDVPAKLLEVNRKIINGFLGPVGRREDQLHPPHRLRGGADDRRRHAGDERDLRRGRGGQAARRPPRPRERRHRGRHGEVGRHAHARRPRHQAGRHPRLRRLPQRLRGPRPSGQDRQAPGHRLPGRHHHDHQPGHHRHRPVGAPPDAGPGRDRRRRHDRLPGRVAGRRRAGARASWPSPRS